MRYGHIFNVRRAAVGHSSSRNVAEVEKTVVSIPLFRYVTAC